jgi:transposase
VHVLDEEASHLDESLAELVMATAPNMLEPFGVDVDTAAVLLGAAGDNSERLRSEAAWAHTSGMAPIKASSGKVTHDTASIAVETAPLTRPCGASS